MNKSTSHIRHKGATIDTELLQILKMELDKIDGDIDKVKDSAENGEAEDSRATNKDGDTDINDDTYNFFENCFSELMTGHNDEAVYASPFAETVRLLLEGVGAGGLLVTGTHCEEEWCGTSLLCQRLRQLAGRALLSALLVTAAKSAHLSVPSVSTALVKFYYTIATPVVMTDAPDIKNCNKIRKLNQGEIFTTLEEPEVHKASGFTRLHGKAVRDDKEGWITLIGIAGTSSAVVIADHG